LRIIAGTHRGHKIAAPKGLDTRPTSDRVRESAFNLIGPVDGASVLDLFAGSGAMGLEALSRGAESATFVEADHHAAETIDENLAKLRLRGARVVRSDAVRALAAEASAGRKYDLVLVDPPYDLYPDLEPMLARYLPHVLADGGLLVVETGARVEPQLGTRDPLRMITAICPGSYDPVTFGHVDVIGRAAAIFDRVVVGVVGAPRHKTPLFELEDRVGFLREALADLDNVEVDVFSELVVEFARKWEAKAIVKGLRVISDFEWEFQMNQLNRMLAPEIETVYVMASPQVSFVSSSGVKEIAAFGGKVDQLVPESVARRFVELYPQGRPGTPENPQE
jgi:pantetheine-phosphate adenylyltransferase